MKEKTSSRFVKLGCCVAAMALMGSMSLAAPPVAYGEKASSGPTDARSIDDLEATIDDPVEKKIDAAEPYSNISDTQIAESASAANANESIALLSAARSSSPVSSFSGADRYDTNAMQAKAGWDSSGKAVVVTGERWPDALSVSGLAGALDCPVILVGSGSLSGCTKDALASLGVESVIVVGDEKSVDAGVVDALGGLGIEVEARLAGADRFATQMAVYEYGAERGLWGGTAIVASGADGGFADVLSVSAAAFAAGLPVFLAADDGSISDAQVAALRQGGFSDAVVLGGEDRVGERAEGSIYGALGKKPERIAGANRYDTSAKVADWSVGRGYLSWDGAAFATGELPYDALGGGALQGREGSVLLLASQGWQGYALDALSSHGGASSIKFFGGYPSISVQVRSEIMTKLDIADIALRLYDVALEDVASIESGRSSYTVDEILETLNPENFTYGDASYYQFAKIGSYTGLVSADQINAFIDSCASYSEERYGVASTMRGAGEYFVAAAKAYDINEVYLVAHAAIESAWGCSTLSQGVVEGYGGYYNFFGIGAYDLDPNNGGAALAKDEGWDSVGKAIMGAAEWISSNYIHPTVSSAEISGVQDTLYKMKWDVARIEQGGDPWHQYATSVTWATDGETGGIAGVMASFYRFHGISITATGLQFEVPVFK